MSEQIHRTVSDHIETRGINVGRFKNTELTRDIADEENILRIASQRKVNPYTGDIDDEVNHVAKHRLGERATDELSTIVGDPNKLAGQHFGKHIDGKGHNIYALQREKVNEDYDKLQQKAADIAKDMTQDSKNSQ